MADISNGYAQAVVSPGQPFNADRIVKIPGIGSVQGDKGKAGEIGPVFPVSRSQFQRQLFCFFEYLVRKGLRHHVVQLDQIFLFPDRGHGPGYFDNLDMDKAVFAEQRLCLCDVRVFCPDVIAVHDKDVACISQICDKAPADGSPPENIGIFAAGQKLKGYARCCLPDYLNDVAFGDVAGIEGFKGLHQYFVSWKKQHRAVPDVQGDGKPVGSFSPDLGLPVGRGIDSFNLFGP